MLPSCKMLRSSFCSSERLTRSVAAAKTREGSAGCIRVALRGGEHQQTRGVDHSGKTLSDLLRVFDGVRQRLKRELEPLALKVACSGTHPQAVWYQTVISSGERYQGLYGSMRELARRR